MEEWVDELDDQGRYTGATLLKSEAHQRGVFHPTVHIWFYTKNGQVLLQQRAETKDTYPLLWDVSVAGHIMAGEDIMDAALREIKEEIGIAESKENLEKIGVFKSVQEHHKLLRDCEFHHTFLCLLKSDIHQLKKQKEEVKDLRLIPLIRMAEETWGLANLSAYVPHGTSYYSTIIKSIQNRLNGS